ncbi:DUF4227 family protein [Paenibacillus sp. 1P07SE]|uniref:DUF4227 family protein n=1 Tax=Paenibacillus sp. 1P07SE TaxID=3132209 RepID=UPI0039A6BEA6
MIISLRKCWELLQFLVLFLMLTIIAVTLYRWAVDWLNPVDPYAMPHGQALKVFQTDQTAWDSRAWLERLQWFYWMGE